MRTTCILNTLSSSLESLAHTSRSSSSILRPAINEYFSVTPTTNPSLSDHKTVLRTSPGRFPPSSWSPGRHYFDAFVYCNQWCLHLVHFMNSFAYSACLLPLHEHTSTALAGRTTFFTTAPSATDKSAFSHTRLLTRFSRHFSAPQAISHLSPARPQEALHRAKFRQNKKPWAEQIPRAFCYTAL